MHNYFLDSIVLIFTITDYVLIRYTSLAFTGILIIIIIIITCMWLNEMFPSLPEAAAVVRLD